MNKAVFDSSAILALYYNERGKKAVVRYLEEYEPLITTPNLSEVFSKLIEDGLDPDHIQDSFNGLEIDVVDFTSKLSLETAKLRPLTKHLGLSFGDRACLAVAIKEKAVAITADKSWKELDLCPIRVIR